jgi:hypothetical protein
MVKTGNIGFVGFNYRHGLQHQRQQLQIDDILERNFSPSATPLL